MKQIVLTAFFLLSACVTQAQQIKILENIKTPDNDTTYVLQYQFKIPIPAIFSALPDKASTLGSFTPLYPGLDHLEDTNVVFKLSHEFYYTDSDTTIKSFLLTQYQNYQYGLGQLQIPTPDWIKGEYWDGTQWQCQN